MRILVVHSRYPGAAPSGENLVVDQEAAALAAAGHEVEVFQRHNEEIASWGALRKAALPVEVLWSEPSRRALLQTLERLRPDVVHLHNTFPLLSPSVLHACRTAAVPVVRTVHNYRLACASGTFFRDGQVCHDCVGRAFAPSVVHGCYRGSRLATVPVAASSLFHARSWRTLVSAHIFISAAQRDLLAPVGLPPDRCFVKHNFVPVPPAADVPREHMVAFVGRLDEAKGAPFLMASWDRFLERRPSTALRLVVAGGGELAGNLERWAATTRGVAVRGLIPRDEAGRILAAARATVVPSQWEETFGLVAVEAMARGSAPVAPRHGAFPELISDGSDGALFPPGDVDALAALLEDVDTRPDHWDALGRRGPVTYEGRFGLDANVAALVDIYRFAIADPIGECPTPGPAHDTPTRSARTQRPQMDDSGGDAAPVRR